MVIATINQGHIKQVGVQCLGGPKSAKTASDYNHSPRAVHRYFSFHLSRSDAATIIKAGRHYPIPVTTPIEVGLVTAYVHDPEEYPLTPDGKAYKADEDAGVINNEWHRLEKDALGQFSLKISRKLTDKGNQYVVSRPFGNTVNIRVCEQDFGEVTGIQMDASGRAAKVEYTWKAGNITPFGEDRIKAGFRLDCGESQYGTSSAILALFDDGWRYSSGGF